MSRRGLPVAVACGVVVMAGLVVASVARPVALLSRPSPAASVPPVPTIPPELRTQQTATPTADSSRLPASDPSPFLIALVQIALVIGAVIVVAVLVRVLLALWRRPRIRLLEDPSFEIPEVPEELLRNADQRVALLHNGAPRNAIVAAWLDLEDSAAATGLPRAPSETSTEYTQRVVGTWEVDRLRLADLAALFREARFSVHDLDESHRRRAIDDLEALHADLSRVASRHAGSRTDLHPDGAREP